MGKLFSSGPKSSKNGPFSSALVCKVAKRAEFVAVALRNVPILLRLLS
jgi:hypothetical protein